MACLICNIAISGNLTWALIPVSSIVFAWIIFVVFKRIERKIAALGTNFLSAIPFTIVVNVILSKMIEEPVLNVWDMLSIFILLILAFASFICDYAKKKGLMK